ncbi:MAG: hypothetical protein RL077_1878 [Verrucomicrobiota bacterium]
MPIEGPASFLPTTDEFLAHWGLVNTALAPGALVLPAGTTRANLDTHRTALGGLHTAVQAAINDVEMARADLDDRKGALHARLTQFNEKARAYLGTTTLARSLPKVPTLSEGQGAWLPVFDDMENLWTRANALAPVGGFTPPLLLLGGYALAAFSADFGLLRGAYKTITTKEVDLRVKRGEREDLENVIYPILKSYREAMPTFFAPEHALVTTLPRLTPEAGSTPDAVVASGVWDVGTLMAKITWGASAAADLKRYEVRWSPGSSYSAADESVLGSVAPDGAREFSTAQGLDAPGAVGVFRVYVITETDNEKGSNTVKVTRPG